jgi:hypothetical protein
MYDGQHSDSRGRGFSLDNCKWIKMLQERELSFTLFNLEQQWNRKLILQIVPSNNIDRILITNYNHCFAHDVYEVIQNEHHYIRHYIGNYLVQHKQKVKQIH